METRTTPSVQPQIHTTGASELPDLHHILKIARRGYKWGLQFVQLPPEVLLLIIDHLNMAERISLLATCSYLRQLSEPLLYRHLNPDNSWKARQRIQLLKTLGERQDLLLHIHSFRGRLIPTAAARPSRPSQEFIDWAPGAIELLDNEWLAISLPLIFQAINIRDLEFINSIDWQENGRWELFKGAVSKMKLRSLSFASNSKGPLDLAPILRGQPELTRLELHCHTAHLDGLRETDAPKLKIVKGSWRQAAMIVPGRPVGRLDLDCDPWGSCRCPEEQIFQKLHQSSATVHTFKAVGHSAFFYTTLRDMLQLVIQYLPEIRDFTICGRGAYFSTPALLNEIPKLSMLNSLVVSEAWFKFNDSPDGASSSGSGHLEIDSWEKVSERLKELCPSLSRCEYVVRQWGGPFTGQEYI